MGANSASVHCIGDDIAWLESIQAKAATPILCLSWAEFNAAPMRFAGTESIAVAYFSGISKKNKIYAGIDQTLGRLCRSYPDGVVVELPGGLAIPDELFFAHGFQKFSRLGKSLVKESLVPSLSSLGDERCFEYRLRDYKSVPGWLNARFWAHPERFHL